MSRFLPYGRQSVDQVDIDSVVKALQSDYLTTGPIVAEFESALASQLGAAYAVVCSSATAALHLAALAAGLGPKKGAVVPSITFVASANAVRFVDAPVYFSDVGENDGLMSVETMRSAIASADGDVGAVVPVHLNGQCADMEEIHRLAREEGMVVIEDASHAIGSSYCNQAGVSSAVGSCFYSDMCVFSFHAIKNIAMAEGGAVTTNDGKFYRKLMEFRNHGIVRDEGRFCLPELAFSSNGELNPWYYEMQSLGFNYRSNDVQCALGLSQLSKLDKFSKRRRKLVARYDRNLQSLGSRVQPIARVDRGAVCWHLYPILIDFTKLEISRAWLMNSLAENGIGTQVHYMPVHQQPYYQNLIGGDVELAGCVKYYQRVLSLPLYYDLLETDVDQISDTLTQLLNLA